MNLKDNGNQLKCLRDRKKRLLKQRDLSINGRLLTAEKEVEKVNCRKAQLIELKNRIMSCSFFNYAERLRRLEVVERVVERQINTLSEEEFKKCLRELEPPKILVLYER